MFIIFLKKEQSRLKNYIELISTCVLFGILIFIFDWPYYIYIVLGFAFLINTVFIEIMTKIKKNNP